MKSESGNIDVVIPVYNNWLALSRLWESMCQWVKVQNNNSR